MKRVFALGVLALVLAVPVLASKGGSVPPMNGEGPFSPPTPAPSSAEGPFSPPTPAPSLEGPFSPPTPAPAA
jgi:hypothetical protein